MSFRPVPNDATQFAESSQCLPSTIWDLVSSVLKAKLSVVSCFDALSPANLNTLIAQERNLNLSQLASTSILGS
jgi:hypothetical protein